MVDFDFTATVFNKLELTKAKVNNLNDEPDGKWDKHPITCF